MNLREINIDILKITPNFWVKQNHPTGNVTLTKNYNIRDPYLTKHIFFSPHHRDEFLPILPYSHFSAKAHLLIYQKLLSFRHRLSNFT